MKLQSFYEIAEHEVYEGVWSCASLLHCECNRLAEVIKLLITALNQMVCRICHLSTAIENEKMTVEHLPI